MILVALMSGGDYLPADDRLFRAFSCFLILTNIVDSTSLLDPSALSLKHESFLGRGIKIACEAGKD